MNLQWNCCSTVFDFMQNFPFATAAGATYICQLLLRQYTDCFAEKIKAIFPQLVEGAEGIPETNPYDDPCEIFDNLPWSTWPEAKLIKSLKYLRGNRNLQVPPEWTAVFPTPFEVLHKLEMKEAQQAASSSQG